MFVWSALACLAVTILGALLLRYAFSADPSDTGIPRNYALALCCTLILSLPVYLLTLKSSKLGTIATWVLTAAIAGPCRSRRSFRPRDAAHRDPYLRRVDRDLDLAQTQEDYSR